MAVRSPGEKDSSFTTECHDTLSNSLQTTVHKQGSTKKTHPGLQGEKATRIHQLPKGPINKSWSVTPPSLGQTAGLLPVRCTCCLRLVLLQRVLDHPVTKGSSQSPQHLLWGGPELRLERS